MGILDENEQFAADIRTAPVTGGNDVDLSRPLAHHLTKLGYRKPQQVTTVQELDKLPPLSVVLDKHDEAFQKMVTDEGAASPLWCSGDIVLSDLIDLPATVLHVGSVEA